MRAAAVMLSLVATILAQCACSGCTITGDLHVDGDIYANALFFNYWAAVGPEIISYRGATDTDADLSIVGGRDPSDVTQGAFPAISLFESWNSVFTVHANGVVNAGTQWAGVAFQPNAGMGSGSIAMRSAPDNYLVFQGMLGGLYALNPDGSMPIYDGGIEVALQSDGGTHWRYAGDHGDETSIPYEQRSGGWLRQIANAPPGHAVQSYFVDSYAGFGIQSSLSFAQFPPPTIEFVATSVGSFHYGTYESTFRYADDYRRWFFSDGTAYHQIETVDEATQAFASMNICDAGVTFTQGLADGGTVSFTIPVAFH